MINPMVFVFIIPAIFFGGYASLFLKKGAEKFTLTPKHILKNINVFVGIFFYGCSMILYIFALKYGDLSVVYPLTSFSYILVAILSVKKLKEKMNKHKWIGIIFIIFGSFLVVS